MDFETEYVDEVTKEVKKKTRVTTPQTLAADALLRMVSMLHIGLDFEVYAVSLRQSSSGTYDEDRHYFMCDSLLRRISAYLFATQQELAECWQACGEMNIGMPRSFSSALLIR